MKKYYLSLYAHSLYSLYYSSLTELFVYSFIFIFLHIIQYSVSKKGLPEIYRQPHLKNYEKVLLIFLCSFALLFVDQIPLNRADSILVVTSLYYFFQYYIYCLLVCLINASLFENCIHPYFFPHNIPIFLLHIFLHSCIISLFHYKQNIHINNKYLNIFHILNLNIFL
jgi:hypothetical protein